MWGVAKKREKWYNGFMEVKVYSADWCPYCHAEMEWLEEMGVEFTEVDVETEGIEVEGLPVTEIGGERILGFDRNAIKAALKKNELI